MLMKLLAKNSPFICENTKNNAVVYYLADPMIHKFKFFKIVTRGEILFHKHKQKKKDDFSFSIARVTKYSYVSS